MNDGKDIVIEVKNLKAAYGEKVILERINFQVRRGEIFVIIGRSGCGKSTLLTHMIGLQEPLEGEVLLEGKDLTAASGEERQNILRQFGVLYQSGALFGSMTVLENVRLPLDQFTDMPPLARDLVALSKLKLVGMAKSAHVMPSELSGGMQKRAALARAMALDPSILFLDEPSVGQDPVTSAELDELIRRLAGFFSITFVIVTHELESIEAIASRVIMIADRTIIAQGTVQELRQHPPDPRVKRFFERQPLAGSESEEDASA